MNEWWKAAAEDAERRFEAGGELTSEDMVAVALAHPDRYDIMIKLKVPS